MRTAVVLMNLGGPDSLEAVRPFLFNLFSDPAIFRLPNPFRWMLAKLVSGKREKEAKQIYAAIGGRSPIVAQTEKQAQALESALAENGVYKTFIAMRYWHPMTAQTVRQVKEWGAERVILLPLYPQFSTTTTASSLKAWRDEAKRQGLNAPAITHCCYPLSDAFTHAYAQLITEAIKDISPSPRLIFSAHGLPERVIESGDPYQYQVEQSVAAIMERLKDKKDDYVISYQSRVGPLKWIGPSTEEEIRRAGKEKKSIAIVPVSFVSEHSETLYELDILCRKLAEEENVPEYIRVPAVGTHPSFIQALKEICIKPVTEEIAGAGGKRHCPQKFTGCPCPIAS